MTNDHKDTAVLRKPAIFWARRSSLRLLLVIVMAGSFMFVDAVRALELPAVFSDHAVLQQGVPMTVWGWAQPGSEVEVSVMDHHGQTNADQAGHWRIELPALEVSKQAIRFEVASDGQTVKLSDVVVGEVWLCSGQSNMAWMVSRSASRETLPAAAEAGELSLVRQWIAPQRATFTPTSRIEAAWQTASAKSVPAWSAVATHFGQQLSQALDVPVGLLNVSRGGSRIEAWIDPEGFESLPTTAHHSAWMRERDASDPAYREDALREFDKPHKQPGTLYNGMLHAVIPYPIAGVIWYQGEANHREPQTYPDLTAALLHTLRTGWERPSLPFYSVQLAPFDNKNAPAHALPVFWETQADPQGRFEHYHTVVINDVGDADDIHPARKAPVGQRLADLALVDTYGQRDRVGYTPAVAEVRVDQNRVLVRFKHVGSALKTIDQQAPTWFELAQEVESEEVNFFPAVAEIIASDTVLLTSPQVEHPTAVRFAWDRFPDPNLRNSDGHPVGSFRVDLRP